MNINFKGTTRVGSPGQSHFGMLLYANTPSYMANDVGEVTVRPLTHSEYKEIKNEYFDKCKTYSEVGQRPPEKKESKPKQKRNLEQKISNQKAYLKLVKKKKRNYWFEAKKEEDDNTKRKRKKPTDSTNRLRIVYKRNPGYKIVFPIHEWEKVFEERSKDCSDGQAIRMKDKVYSEEFIRCFFELVYTNNTELTEINNHCMTAMDIVSEYYVGMIYANISMNVIYSNKKVHTNKKSITHCVRVVFPEINIQQEHGIQMCLSFKNRIEKKFGKYNIVRSSYEFDPIITKPVYSTDRVSCVKCKDNGIVDENCKCDEGHVFCGSPYVPYMTATGNKVEYHNEEDKVSEAEYKKWIRISSVIPVTRFETKNRDSKIGNCITEGYRIPPTELVAIPTKLRSTNIKDKNKSYVYKLDRLYMNKKITRSFTELTHRKFHSRILKYLRSFGSEYNSLNVSDVYYNKHTYHINVRGFGSSFCKINGRGIVHSDCRIFFRLDKKSTRITQECFHPSCNQHKRNNVPVKEYKLVKLYQLF